MRTEAVATPLELKKFHRKRRHPYHLAKSPHLPVEGGEKQPIRKMPNHKLFICKEHSLEGGVEYNVLDHQLETVKFCSHGKERPARIAMSLVTEAAFKAIETLHKTPSRSRLFN